MIKLIEQDLKQLKKQNLSINILIEDIKDSSQDYKYTLDDLMLYLFENKINY